MMIALLLLLSSLVQAQPIQITSNAVHSVYGGPPGSGVTSTHSWLLIANNNDVQINGLLQPTDEGYAQLNLKQGDILAVSITSYLPYDEGCGASSKSEHTSIWVNGVAVVLEQFNVPILNDPKHHFVSYSFQGTTASIEFPAVVETFIAMP